MDNNKNSSNRTSAIEESEEAAVSSLPVVLVTFVLGKDNGRSKTLTRQFVPELEYTTSLNLDDNYNSTFKEELAIIALLEKVRTRCLGASPIKKMNRTYYKLTGRVLENNRDPTLNGARAIWWRDTTVVNDLSCPETSTERMYDLKIIQRKKKFILPGNDDADPLAAIGDSVASPEAAGRDSSSATAGDHRSTKCIHGHNVSAIIARSGRSIFPNVTYKQSLETHLDSPPSTPSKMKRTSEYYYFKFCENEDAEFRFSTIRNKKTDKLIFSIEMELKPDRSDAKINASDSVRDAGKLYRTLAHLWPALGDVCTL